MRRFLLGSLIALLAVSSVVFGGPLWQLVTTRVEWALGTPKNAANPTPTKFSEVETIGWRRVSRLSGHATGEEESYYVANGYLAERMRGDFRRTVWESSGKLVLQSSREETRYAPPWIWGEVDQRAPSAPWLEAGCTAREWWERSSPGAPLSE